MKKKEVRNDIKSLEKSAILQGKARRTEPLLTRTQENLAPAARSRRSSQKHAEEDFQLIKTCSWLVGLLGNVIEKMISNNVKTSGPCFEKEFLLANSTHMSPMF